MRAARYARVSTHKQADNTSIPNQLERMEAYIEAQGWELVATFTEPGESGENLDRPALTSARQAARRGEYDVLVVYVLDRLTRNIDDLFLLRREFAGLGIKVLAVHDGLDVTTADVDDLLGVLFKGYFGHRELATIRRRIVEGIERHVKAGKYPGGYAPYGYKVGDDQRLVIDEETAPIVRLIFDWSVDGMSSRAIARRLNALQVPSPLARKGIETRQRDGTRHTPIWKAPTVRHILKAETYVGRWTYGRRGETFQEIVVEVPALVDRGTWEKAHEALQANRHYTRPPRYAYLLRGKIQCECGASYCGRAPRREGGPHGYCCTARYRWEQGTHKCKSLTISGSELEAAVWADLEQFVRQPHLVAAELSQRRGPAGEGVAARLAEIDQRIAARKGELDRCLSLYVRGTIPVEQLDAKAQEIRDGLAALAAYRAGLVEEQRRADLWEREMLGVVEALTALQGRLDAGLAFEDKRAVVEALVKGILIETRTDDDGEPFSVAHVTYRFEQPEAEAPIPLELAPLFSLQWRDIDNFAGLRYNSARAEVARRTGGPDPPVWLRLRVSRQEDGVLEVVNESAIRTA